MCWLLGHIENIHISNAPYWKWNYKKYIPFGWLFYDSVLTWHLLLKAFHLMNYFSLNSKIPFFFRFHSLYLWTFFFSPKTHLNLSNFILKTYNKCLLLFIRKFDSPQLSGFSFHSNYIDSSFLLFFSLTDWESEKKRKIQIQTHRTYSYNYYYYYNIESRRKKKKAFH